MVRTLAAEGRVQSSPRYHASVHRVRFADVVAALYRCIGVRPDPRQNISGQPLHPNGFIAHGRLPAGALLRIDFDFVPASEPKTIQVVTAFPVNP